MSDTLRTRIARAIYNEVLETSDGYVEGQESNYPVDPTDPEELLTVDCRISFTDLADAVIRELESDYILVPKSHTVARWIPEGIFDERT